MELIYQELGMLLIIRRIARLLLSTDSKQSLCTCQ